MDQFKVETSTTRRSSMQPAQKLKPLRRYGGASWMQLYLLLMILATIVALWIYTAFEFNSVHDALMRTWGGANRFSRSRSYRKLPRAATRDPYIFEVNELPKDPRFLPTISNGHIATSVFDDCIKMNAFFNGRAGFTYPACIPAPFKINWKRVSQFATPSSSNNTSAATAAAHERHARSSADKKSTLSGGDKFPPAQRTNMLIGDKYEVLGSSYQLDVRTGVFTESTNISLAAASGQRAAVTKRSYMHRSPAHNRVYVVQISFQSYQEEMDELDDVSIVDKMTTTTSSRPSALRELVLPFVSLTSMFSTHATNDGIPTPTSPDLDIAPVQLLNISGIGTVCVMNGTTKAAEFVDSGKQNVSVVWSCAAETDASTNFASEGIFRLRADQGTILLASVSVDYDDALKHYIAAWQQRDSLLMQHQQAWSALWSAGRIEVDASQSFNLSQAVAAAQYYLWTDIRLLESDVIEGGAGSVLDAVPFHGLAPGGLAKGMFAANYQGHVFWDMDTWMFPGVLWTQPLLARQLIRARSFQLDAAKQNAQRQGDKGARFPWESARTGWEVSPWNISALYEIHVSCDVSLALKTYLQTTGDTDAIERYRFGEMAYGIAEYYLGRSTLDANGTRHIDGVCPPDEYHAPVNDSVYTNYCAAQSLLLPEYLCTLARTRGRDASAVPAYCANDTAMLKEFSDAARALVILLEEYNGQMYHAEFEGFVPHKEAYLVPGIADDKRKLVKQADAVLLQYPLMANETADIQRNDLSIYESCTDFDGPAMTWGSFAINLLELGQTAAADSNFVKQFVNILPGFGMWSEAPKGEGAVNFLTGMGGFLQSIVNGYFGYRVDVAKYASFDTDLDVFNCFRLQPRALPGNIPFTIAGLNFQNTTFNVEVTDAYYAYITLDAVPRNVKQVNICDKLMANTCKVVEPGKEVIVNCGVEKFMCLTFA